MDSTDLALTKFGIGQPVARKEDPTLLRGAGRYTDDVNLAGQAHAVMVRSRVAHGTIGAIDADAARAMPGVLGVFNAADLAGYGPIKPAILIPNRDGSPMRAPLRPALPKDRVRFVGEAVAFVKGCGEAGCAGSLPSVMNAVVDALSVYGIRHIDMPATPERVWQAIEAARAS